MSKFIVLFFLINFCPLFGQDTFTIIGDAYGINDISSASCPDVDTCFTLTDDIQGQTGAVWDDTPIDLSENFDALFCLTLGVNDANGADGFAFVMRGIGSQTIGNVGGGIGYEGIAPSIAIEYDTWDNGVPNDDIPEDHTGLYVNADHANPLLGSVPLDPTGINVEDGNYHNTRIVWDAQLYELKMYFDGVLRLSQTVNLIDDVFGGNNLIFWGFTSSTGGSTNLQQICFPYTSIHVEDKIACLPDSVALHFYTEGITSYTWSTTLGDTIVDWNSIDYADPFDLSDTLIYVHESGDYVLNISFNNNSYSSTAAVTLVPLPTPPFNESEFAYCPDDEDLILDALNPGMSYVWSPQFPDEQVITDNGNVGWYSVTIIEPINQCSISDSIYVDSYCTPVVVFPNVFTPNDDGINDLYLPQYKVDPKWVSIEEFTIQNRWGNVVYSYKLDSNSPMGWNGMYNGTPVTEGVYFYTVVHSDILLENRKSEHGYLHLIRGK